MHDELIQHYILDELIDTVTGTKYLQHLTPYLSGCESKLKSLLKHANIQLSKTFSARKKKAQIIHCKANLRC
jgi:hypothetical protein